MLSWPPRAEGSLPGLWEVRAAAGFRVDPIVVFTGLLVAAGLRPGERRSWDWGWALSM